MTIIPRCHESFVLWIAFLYLVLSSWNARWRLSTSHPDKYFIFCLRFLDGGGILKLISCLSQFLELIPPFLFCIYWTLIGCTPVASNFFIYFREKLTRRNWHVDVCLFGSSISARQTQVFFFSFHIRFFFFFVYKDLPPPPPPQPAAIVFYTLTKNLLFWFFYVLVEDVGGD